MEELRRIPKSNELYLENITENFSGIIIVHFNGKPSGYIVYDSENDVWQYCETINGFVYTEIRHSLSDLADTIELCNKKYLVGFKLIKFEY